MTIDTKLPLYVLGPVETFSTTGYYFKGWKYRSTIAVKCSWTEISLRTEGQGDTRVFKHVVSSQNWNVCRELTAVSMAPHRDEIIIWFTWVSLERGNCDYS